MSKACEGGRWTTLLYLLLKAEMEKEWHVYNRGIGGDTTWHALDRFDDDIKPLLPAYVLIEYGFNDASVPEGRRIARCGLAAFRENISEIIRKVRAGKGKPILIVNHPICPREIPQGNRRTYVQNFRPYQAAIRELAKATKTPMIDLEREMVRAGVDLHRLLTKDGLHLSAEGNAIYANFVFASFASVAGIKVKGALPPVATWNVLA